MSHFETDTMSCPGMVEKWRLRSEVHFDDLHFEQFHVDWQDSAHCLCKDVVFLTAWFRALLRTASTDLCRC